MPPLSLILDNLRNVILPAFLPSLAVMLLGWAILGVRFSRWWGGLAVIAGLMVGNHSTEALSLTPGNSALTWILPLTGLAILVGMLASVPQIPRIVGELLRLGVAVFAAQKLTPSDLQSQVPGLMLMVVVAIYGLQSIAAAVDRQRPGGAIVACHVLPAGMLAGVLIFAHSNRMMDAAHLLFASLAGVMLLAWYRKPMIGPALAASSIMLPGLALAGIDQTFSEVPKIAFVLPAIAPILAGIVLLPKLKTLSPKWGVIVLLLAVLSVAGTGLGLAIQHESLPTVEDEEW
ncbi:hypothetical protein [Tuwongella immobilis]|uniref:Uncharacterized protein n=1 Tax=Tuwongella immobilis TaxID=692036 RepID=A0A6C2YJS2_9BACT|nr:hypothetical protein [Tuwongella immobilis]VIP01666.1 unnamed protein product [Tuwongella immobilis]VTR99086.1 unnamed protein product [Tuwongella immobilis]